MFIYKITTPTGGVYVGRTKNFNLRMKEHEKRCHNRRLKFSIKKYGWEAHKKEIIYTAKSLKELAKKELFYIEKYLKSYVKGKVFNSLIVEKGLLTHSEGTCKKIGELHKKRFENNPELRSFYSEKLKEEYKNGIRIKHQLHTGKLVPYLDEVIKMIEEGYTLSYISKKFNYNCNALYDIVAGKMYKGLISEEKLTELRKIVKENNSNNISHRFRGKGVLTNYIPTIVSMIEKGYTLAEISKKFNCSSGDLSCIIKGKIYKGLIPENKLIKLQSLVKLNSSKSLINRNKDRGKLIEHIKEIKDLLDAKYTQQEIADYFNISIGMINRIKLGKSYINL